MAMMAEELQRLEADLQMLASATVYPPTPPLAAAVRRRLAAAPARRPLPAWTPLAAAAAAIAVIVLSLAAAAPARDAVADLFHRINIFEASQPIPNVPTEITGEEVTLAEAEDRLGSAILLPAFPKGIEGYVSAVRYEEFPPSGLKTVSIFFTHPAFPPLVLIETSGFVSKGLPRETATAEPVPGLSPEAYWIEGRHFVQYSDPQGRAVPETARTTAEHTLVWLLEGQVLRIEGGLSRDEAILVAQSLR